LVVRGVVWGTADEEAMVAVVGKVVARGEEKGLEKRPEAAAVGLWKGPASARVVEKMGHELAMISRLRWVLETTSARLRRGT
jgi:hypothetical protein